MFSASVLFFSFCVGISLANNDWSKPCLSGVCQYDLPSNGSTSGTLKIWGSDNTISDITPAAGWQIIDCSPDALQQDIRLVCASGSSNCTHLYDGSSDVNAAVGKIVRLPENCGKSAFAVVTKSYIPQDQSVPSSIAPTNGTKLSVRGLSLSTNFSSVKPSSAGPVNFVLQAANVPGAQADLPTSPQQQRRSNSRVFSRGITSFVQDAVDGISSLNDFNVSKSTTLSPVDVDKSFNLVNQNVSCPPVDASVKIDVDGKLHAVASIGVAASGTILPPVVSDFSLIAGLNADIDGSLDLKASASGSLDSGKIKLFSVGIPGLDFPGILTIGPSFDIDGQATATLDVDVDMTVGITYTIDNAQLTFPPKGSSSGSFSIGDTPLKLSANPSVTATGSVNAHLIPTLNFGISALADEVSATVFLALDASATMTLTGQASADASATVDSKRDLSRELNARQSDGSFPDDGSEALDGSSDDTDTADDGDEGDSVADSDDDPQGDSGNSDASADEDEGTQDDSDVDDTDDADFADDSQDDSQPDDDGSNGAGDSVDPSIEAGDDDTQENSAADVDTTDDSPDVPEDDPNGAVDPTGDADSDNSDATDGSADASATAGTVSDVNTDPPSASTVPASGGTIPGLPSSVSSPLDDSDNSSSSTNIPSTGSVLVSTSANATFGGCFSVDAALDVNAGANGNFFGLFNPNTKVDLFNQKFEIFKKCFGSNSASGQQRRSLPSTILPRLLSRSQAFTLQLPNHSRLEGRGFSLTCPSTSEGANSVQQSVADETVPAAQIAKE